MGDEVNSLFGFTLEAHVRHQGAVRVYKEEGNLLLPLPVVLPTGDAVATLEACMATAMEVIKPIDTEEGRARIDRRKLCRDRGLPVDEADLEADDDNFRQPYTVGCTSFQETSPPMEAYALSAGFNYHKISGTSNLPGIGPEPSQKDQL